MHQAPGGSVVIFLNSLQKCNNNILVEPVLIITDLGIDTYAKKDSWKVLQAERNIELMTSRLDFINPFRCKQLLKDLNIQI